MLDSKPKTVIVRELEIFVDQNNGGLPVLSPAKKFVVGSCARTCFGGKVGSLSSMTLDSYVCKSHRFNDG